MPARLLIGVVIILAISLGFFALLMLPPLKELGLMALYLTITALVSALAGYIAYRLGWITAADMRRIAEPMKHNSYGQYLLSLLEEGG